ncbi:hypothetical protein OG889_39890 [Streptomyces sp. NBC_00481]|uniref:hypothetical protein n=1 Tax=unclassified Streptomyces TaxID=2593676 RepID=UPI002DD7ED0D|nr:MULTISPECIES: hypothetical protein [unclassified Streptomyces]WRZ00312.1 hypothetical protein OG889_39890 [Streptomyces sp. NBC_00481]
MQLISTRLETLRMQMQGYATVAAAEAQGDDLIGEVDRADWMRIRGTGCTSRWALIPTGPPASSPAAMLGSTLAAIALPPMTAW